MKKKCEGRKERGREAEQLFAHLPLMGNKKSQVERKTRAIIFNKCAQGRAIFICVYMDGISLVVVGG